MRLIESLKKKKFILFNIFFTLYIGINLIGGERGLISYFDKKRIYEELEFKDKVLTSELKDLEHKILLIKNNDLDQFAKPGVRKIMLPDDIKTGDVKPFNALR